MILIEFLQGDYWKVIAYGTNPDDYTVEANQKIIIDHNWPLKPDTSAYNKDEVVWDDKDEQVILYPEHLKLAIHKEKTLKECRDMLKGNLNVLDDSALRAIAKDIKDAESINDVNTAKASIEVAINAQITNLGF